MTEDQFAMGRGRRRPEVGGREEIKRRINQPLLDCTRRVEEEIKLGIRKFSKRRQAAQYATKREADHRRVCAKGNVSEAVQHTRL